ncbi:MAG: crotonase/enoyl-CoA hydratase family protein [Pseudomonadota bacterium]
MNAMTELKNLRIPMINAENGQPKYRQLDVEYDPATRSVWTYMKPTGPACFNLDLLSDLKSNDEAIGKNQGTNIDHNELFIADYSILGSRAENLFIYGGDLALFVLLIKSKNRDALLHYARLCVDCIYSRVTNHNTSSLTISLVQGDALGGGFEYALTSNVIIAEESARMGFPEILFNLFPGMGAYSLLARRLGAKKAEEMILSGKIYGARELHEIGIIDVLAPAGRGEHAVYEFMRKNSRQLNGMRAMYQCRHHTWPLSREELMNITEVWVDAALRLQSRDLKMMSRLAEAQLRQNEARKKARRTDRSSELATAI